eukprot:CAMPEP_0197179422 /NCGR_PEP_ID=MMETSP1423-20130617/4376_1 /TAXON_ID=476441 /ORGANISM="Pseudo-nitzschia heimii, Strain UNC1101" /LENGTH=447 /DNA_ID=CAMNT_0042629333 /DNA_START=346 /DNA_END=1686 /DNA_ORIENTATION=+
MASRHGGSKDHRNMDDGQGRSRGNPERQLRQHQKPRHHEATTDAAPVYITIGPQCCGKSSFLKEFKENTIKDISLDDQRDVYVPIQTETFLHAYDAKAADDDADDKQVKLLQRVYHGKTLAERIRENIELILILRRWNDDSTAADFERRIKSYYEERKYSESVALKLIEAVEEFLSNKPSLPKRTDVFVLESLFKPHPEIGQSAIKRSYEELRETPRHIPVAWGNTNSKTKDYEKVLEICHQKRRPLHFIVCHPTCSRQGASDADNESELLTLPWLPFEELLKRNLNRLQSQGRFVPSNAIADCCQRVTALIPVNIAKSGSTQARNKIVEEHLVAIATGGRGPHRHGNRHPTPSFRYSLTKHRLIQKEYTRNNDGTDPRITGQTTKIEIIVMNTATEEMVEGKEEIGTTIGMTIGLTTEGGMAMTIATGVIDHRGTKEMRNPDLDGG